MSLSKDKTLKVEVYPLNLRVGGIAPNVLKRCATRRLGWSFLWKMRENGGFDALLFIQLERGNCCLIFLLFFLEWSWRSILFIIFDKNYISNKGLSFLGCQRRLATTVKKKIINNYKKYERDKEVV